MVIFPYDLIDYKYVKLINICIISSKILDMWYNEKFTSKDLCGLIGQSQYYFIN